MIDDTYTKKSSLYALAESDDFFYPASKRTNVSDCQKAISKKKQKNIYIKFYQNSLKNSVLEDSVWF